MGTAAQDQNDRSAEDRVTQQATLVNVDPFGSPRKLKRIVDSRYVSPGVNDVFQDHLPRRRHAAHWCATTPGQGSPVEDVCHQAGLHVLHGKHEDCLSFPQLLPARGRAWMRVCGSCGDRSGHRDSSE